VLRARGVGPQRIVGVQHLADVESRSEGAAGLHVLVIMGHVGSEHDPAAAGMDADELHAWGVAADRVQTDARSQLDRSVVEPHPPGEVEPHYADDILDFKRARKERVPHIAPGRVVQLDFLQMKLRRWEAVKRQTFDLAPLIASLKNFSSAANKPAPLSVWRRGGSRAQRGRS
jgi:hypothetical protein